MSAPYTNYHASFIPSLSNLDEINTELQSFEQGIIDIEVYIQQRMMLIDTRTAVRKALLKQVGRCSPENELLRTSLTHQLDEVNEEIADDWREYNYYFAQLVRYMRVRDLIWEQRDLAFQNTAS